MAGDVSPVAMFLSRYLKIWYFQDNEAMVHFGCILAATFKRRKWGSCSLPRLGGVTSGELFQMYPPAGRLQRTRFWLLQVKGERKREKLLVLWKVLFSGIAEVPDCPQEHQKLTVFEWVVALLLLLLLSVFVSLFWMLEWKPLKYTANYPTRDNRFMSHVYLPR